jgi:hypothetical protein
MKKLCGLAAFAVVLLAILSASPASAAELHAIPQLAAPAAAGCGQALALPAKGESCSAAQPESLIPGVIEASQKLGYCHCGCTTARCHTSADCGGSSCDQTISCC